ncbi:MAG: nucleotide exchange factor GrpE [Planctomycetes bacterium]|nr:nucleotide exchange factor GrpE [Planctomycetota bacterium]
MKEESNIIQQGSDAVLQLFQVLQQLIGTSMSNCLQDMPGQIVHLSNQISQVETKQQQSLYDLESVKQQLEKLASINKLLENASETNQLLSQEHYNQHIIEPMVRSLFSIFDLITDSHKHHSDFSSKEMGPMYSVYSQLQQFLANYGIEIIKHTTGDSFNPKTMKPIKWEITSEEHLEKSIARSLQIGFKLGQTRVLRMETVSLFKYQPSETNSVTLSERTEK